MKIKTFVNHGRIMAKCPKCDNAHVVSQNDTALVCPACWKGLKAQKFETDRFGALVAVPHVQLILETRDEARAKGEEYELEMPDPRVMKILRKRPVENMNWEPHETLEFLLEENRAHGLEGA